MNNIQLHTIYLLKQYISWATRQPAFQRWIVQRQNNTRKKKTIGCISLPETHKIRAVLLESLKLNFGLPFNSEFAHRKRNITFQIKRKSSVLHDCCFFWPALRKSKGKRNLYVWLVVSVRLDCPVLADMSGRTMCALYIYRIITYNIKPT